MNYKKCKVQQGHEEDVTLSISHLQLQLLSKVMYIKCNSGMQSRK